MMLKPKPHVTLTLASGDIVEGKMIQKISSNGVYGLYSKFQTHNTILIDILLIE